MSGSYFFTFDGIDGSGKSTQIGLFVKWLESLGHEVITCRDPGARRWASNSALCCWKARRLAIGPRAETLVFMAARAELVEEVVRPALARGQVVVADRFLLATVVYQGHGFDLDPGKLWNVGAFATGGLEPTQTMLLDVDVSRAFSRRQGTPDRLEQRDAVYFEKLRQGFLTEAACRPDQIAVIDAGRGVGEIQADIQAVATSCFAK